MRSPATGRPIAEAATLVVAPTIGALDATTAADRLLAMYPAGRGPNGSPGRPRTAPGFFVRRRKENVPGGCPGGVRCGPPQLHGVGSLPAARITNTPGRYHPLRGVDFLRVRSPIRRPGPHRAVQLRLGPARLAGGHKDVLPPAMIGRGGRSDGAAL
jgi:hypothetical protein